MTLAGWIFLALSWTAIITLVAFCFSKVLSLRVENIVAPLDIDTEQPVRPPRKTRGKKKR